MCGVLNKHKVGVPAGAVYIGRGSKWGSLLVRAAGVSRRPARTARQRRPRRTDRVVALRQGRGVRGRGRLGRV